MSDLKFADGEPMTEDEILHAAQAELSDEPGSDTDRLRENWDAAYGYYKGELPGATDATTSKAISTDVADTIEWMLPAIMKPLIESPDVVRFDPVNPEDQQQADMESDYVHHTFMKKCGGFEKLYVHIKDALLLKVGVFFTYWDDTVRNQFEPYKGLTEAELADLLFPDDGSTVRVLSSEARQRPLVDPATGAPMQPPPQPQMPPGPPGMPQEPLPPPPPLEETVYDVDIRRFTTNGAPKVVNCVPENFSVRMSQDSINLADARRCSYQFEMTRAELYAMGYDKEVVAELPAGESSAYDDEVRRAREDVEEEYTTFGHDRNETGDPSQDSIQVYWVYMMLDIDGDGFEERYLIILAGRGGKSLLDYYEVPENPFSASTPFIAGHKFHGYSLFDKVVELANRKTKTLRMLEDNLDLVNNPRKRALRGQCSLNDLLQQAPGAVWREDQPGAVNEVPTPPVSQQAFALLDYYDKIRSERTGIDPNAQSATNMMPEESMNTAMERVLSMKEEVVGLMIRVFAETGVKSMFLKLRGLLLRNNPYPETVQLRNKWTEINPGNWIERTNTSVVVGLGTGDRIRKAAGLTQMFGMQQEAMKGGLQGVTISPERINYTLSELVRVQGLGDPDDYVLNPEILFDERNAQTPRGREIMRAMQRQQEQIQQEQQAQQAQQQAQQQQQQELLDLQREVEQMRQQGKIAEAQIKAQTADKDRESEMGQFMREMRIEWAKLVAEVEADRARNAATIGTALVQQGANLESAKIAADATEAAAAKEKKTDE